MSSRFVNVLSVLGDVCLQCAEHRGHTNADMTIKEFEKRDAITITRYKLWGREVLIDWGGTQPLIEGVC